MEDINENNEGIEQTILNEDNQPATIPEPPQPTDEVPVDEDYNLPTDANGEPIYTSEWLRKYTSISGWLSFFLLTVGLGGLVSAFYNLFMINIEEYGNNMYLYMSEIVLGLALLGIAIYTIYAFVMRKPNAVFFARLYIILVLVTNVFALIGGEFDSTGWNTAKRSVQASIMSVVWLVFLIVSKKVKEVIPPSYRKVTWKDWLFTAAVAGLPVLLIIVGALRDYSTAKKIETDESIMLTTQLAENERTDGRIIFTVPEVFTCDKINVPIEDGQLVTIHNLHNQETSDYGTIGSDYEMDWSQKAFDKYLSDWEDENASMLSPTIEDSGTTLINGRECIYRVTSYDLDVAGKAYWRFYLLYDKETNKMALLSFYDKNDDPSYIQTLLESIRFK